MALPMKRVMKSKSRKSKIARGVMAKSLVFSGRREKTSGGITKDGLIKNKRGKVVSRKRSALAKRLWAASALKKWSDALRSARKALNIIGFVSVNGKSAQGKALYAKAKVIVNGDA